MLLPLQLSLLWCFAGGGPHSHSFLLLQKHFHQLLAQPTTGPSDQHHSATLHKLISCTISRIVIMDKAKSTVHKGIQGAESTKWMQTQRKEMQLKDRFSQYNQTTVTKLNQAQINKVKDSQNTSKVNELESRVEATIQRQTEEVANYRRKITAIRQTMKEQEKKRAERSQKTMARIKKLTAEAQIQMAKQRYMAGEVLAQAEQDFDDALKQVIRHMDAASNKSAKDKLDELKQLVVQTLSQIKGQSSSFNQRQEKLFQESMINLEQKVVSWRQKMVQLDATQQQQRQKYQKQIEELYKNLNEAVIEQANTRQDNKQKLMVLFEGRVEQVQNQIQPQ